MLLTRITTKIQPRVIALSKIHIQFLEKISAYLVKQKQHSLSKNEFGVAFAPRNPKWRRIHIQTQLRKLHTKFQLIWSKYCFSMKK